MRRIPLHLLLVVAFALLSPVAPAGDAEPLQMDDKTWAAFKEKEEALKRAALERLEKATVWVVGMDGGTVVNNGSGFMVADGIVMTNAHVASNRNHTYYVLNHHMPVMRTELIAQGDPRIRGDYALLRFEPPAGLDLPVLSFATEIRRLEKVYAWGYPDLVITRDSSIRNFNLDSNEHAPSVVVTEGAVSTVIEPDDIHRLIIHSAEISPGNSGGPLVNELGELVGMNTHLYIDQETSKSTNNAIAAENLAAFMRDVGVEPRMVTRSGGGSNKVWWRTASENVARSDGNQEADLTPAKILARAAEGDPEMMLMAGINYYRDEEGFTDDNDEEAEYWLARAFETTRSYDAAAYYGLTLIFRSIETAPLGLEYLALAANAAVVGLADPSYINEYATILYRADSLHIPFDRVRAVIWAHLAADMGGLYGQALLARVLFNNMDGRKQNERARDLAAYVLEQDENQSDARAVVAYYQNLTGEKKAARAQAIIAAEDHAGVALALLSMFHRQGEVAEQNWALAYDYGTRAVMQGEPYGLAVMAAYHAAGEEHEQDLVAAWVHMRYAIEKSPSQEYISFLQNLESRMTPEQMQRAYALEKRWLDDWAAPESGYAEEDPEETTEESGETTGETAGGSGGAPAEYMRFVGGLTTAKE